MFSGWTALRLLTESVQQFLMEIQKMEHSKALDPGRTHVHQDLKAEARVKGLFKIICSLQPSTISPSFFDLISLFPVAFISCYLLFYHVSW